MTFYILTEYKMYISVLIHTHKHTYTGYIYNNIAVYRQTYRFVETHSTTDAQYLYNIHTARLSYKESSMLFIGCVFGEITRLFSRLARGASSAQGVYCPTTGPGYLLQSMSVYVYISAR